MSKDWKCKDVKCSQCPSVWICRKMAHDFGVDFDRIRHANVMSTESLRRLYVVLWYMKHNRDFPTDLAAALNVISKMTQDERDTIELMMNLETL